MSKTKNRFQSWKYSLKKVIPSIFWSALAWCVRKRRANQFSEKRVRLPLNNSEDLYVIRRQPPGAGLFSNLNHVLQGLLRAQDLKLTPVVDMQNYWTWYSQKGPFLGTRNSWEYFFKPLNQIEIVKISRSNGLTLSKGDRILENHWLSSLGLEFASDREKIQELHNLWRKNFILNEFSQKLLDDTKSYLGWNPEITLGVSFRGTEYSEVKPKGHAVQPSSDVFLKECEYFLSSQQHQKLFISSEDVALRKALHKLDGIYCYPEFRNSVWFREKLISMTNERNLDSEIVRTFGYLIEIYILSECDSLIASIANGSAGALIINGNKYRDTKIFQLGCY